MRKSRFVQCMTLSSIWTLVFLSSGSGSVFAAAKSLVLEEVIVTAQRREQPLQEVPLSISSFSGEEMELLGAQDITALSQTTPNVTIEVSRGTNTTLTSFIRGVGQQDPVAGFEAGVGLYIDDVYLNRPQGSVLEIYDIERIEVLRGPQGTLYGRNTIGGAIKYVTKRLAEEPEGRIRGSVGTHGQYDGILTASTPVSGTLRIGGSLASFNRDGFGDNVSGNGLDNYNREILAARGSIEWTPTPDVFFRLTGDYLDDDSDQRQGHRRITGIASGAPVLGDVFDTRAGLNNPKQEQKAWGVSLSGEWHIKDKWTIKNILSYRDDEAFQPIDFDSLPVDDFDVPVNYRNDQFSEEFQILYESERLSGLFGVYYLDASAFHQFDVILGPLGTLIGLPGLNAFTLGDVKTKTWSVFGDFTYDISDTISIALGGRYTEDERKSMVLRQTKIGGTSPVFGGTAVAISTTSDFRGEATFDEFTPRASIAWHPVDNHNLYFTYSKGFKGGGFDPRGLTTAAPDIDGDGDIDDADVLAFMSFEPETVNSFEIGYKTTLFDKRLSLSLAGFIANYEDVQIPGSIGLDTNGDGVDDSFIGVTSNAGKADINGVEFEGRALLGFDVIHSGDDVRFSWALGYIDAEFDEFIDAFGVDVAGDVNFQNTPKWTTSGTLNYSTPFSIMTKNGILSLINSISYRSKTFQFENPNPLLDQDGYTLWDASLVWEDDEGRWQIGIHAKNITDKEYIIAGYDFATIDRTTGAVLGAGLGLEGVETAFYGNPRTVTGTISYRF